MSPESRAIAEVFAAVWERCVSETPLRRHGDELELAEFVLKAWNRADAAEEMELQTLGALTMGFLPPLVLTELVEASDDPDVAWLTSWDAVSMAEVVSRSGIAVWCREMGFPLQSVSATTSKGAAPAKPIALEEALGLVRERRDNPSTSDELDAYAALDRAVRDALPLCHDFLRRVESAVDFDDEELRALLGSGLRLLAISRIAASVALPGIAWAAPDPEGAESWMGYLFTAVRVGLALRVYAETGSQEERAAAVLFDDDDLELLVRPFEPP